MTAIRTLPLPSGSFPFSDKGHGGWPKNSAKRKTEIAALQLGLDLGISLIDTAEMYGDGAAEELIGEAIAGRRPEVFLVSKVYPHNATQQGAIQACERSLRRLQTDYLDCYLLHWRGSVPLIETIEAFQTLRSAGKIRYGVSNFDATMEDALHCGDEIVTDQVLYNLEHRGIEWDLLPWCQERHSPSWLIRRSAFRHSEKAIAEKSNSEIDCETARRHPGAGCAGSEVVATGRGRHPEATVFHHVRENRGALELKLTKQDFIDLNEPFPPPQGEVPSEMNDRRGLNLRFAILAPKIAIALRPSIGSGWGPRVSERLSEDVSSPSAHSNNFR